MRNIQFFRIAGAMISARVVPLPPSCLRDEKVVSFIRVLSDRVEFNEIGIEQYCFWCKLYTFTGVLLAQESHGSHE